MTLRIGHGYDVHRFEKGRTCVIGGVEIPFEMGLAGHSDADVLLHAIAMRCWAPRHWAILENFFRTVIRLLPGRTVCACWNLWFSC